MKNFNIFGLHKKIQYLRGVHENQYVEGDYLKRRVAWTVSRLKGGGGGGAWQERGGSVFEGGLIPQCTL